MTFFFYFTKLWVAEPSPFCEFSIYAFALSVKLLHKFSNQKLFLFNRIFIQYIYITNYVHIIRISNVDVFFIKLHVSELSSFCIYMLCPPITSDSFQGISFLFCMIFIHFPKVYIIRLLFPSIFRGNIMHVFYSKCMSNKSVCT